MPLKHFSTKNFREILKEKSGGKGNKTKQQNGFKREVFINQINS